MKRKLTDHDVPTTSLQSPIKVKEEDSPSSTSHNGKQKRNNASRTGTACDRCRIRKMRCDDNPDGCASCRQAQTECKTTDRITGKATGRGYVDDLESRLSRLELQNHELRAQVVALGGQLKADSYESQHGANKFTLPPNGHHAENADPYLPHRPATVNGFYDGGAQEPPRRKSSSGNNYFGISSGNSLLSSVRGTSMNVLGMEIDLTGYLSLDVDEPSADNSGQPVYNKSYRSFVNTAFGLGPKLDDVRLPPRSEGLSYAELFLRITNPFVPLVHKPTFLRLFERTYDDPHFQPTAAEVVTVHATLAIAYCQTASRGATGPQHRQELENATNFHYHYALGHFPQLMASHTLADVQALGILCVFLRNCPKPGASWMLTSITLDVALELGLHRSAKHWAPSVKRNMIEIEMRKRVFWSVNWIHVLIGGALGRPMALQAGDWDVEIPEAVDDELLSENGLDTTRKGRCEFLAGIENFKIIPIYMDLYNIVYAVGDTPHDYEDTVRNLERRLREWHAQWPADLVHDSAPNEVRSVHVQYLNIWSCHVRLLLRHPSLSFSTSAQFNAESLTKCLEASNTLLRYVKILQTNRALDVTWSTSALFVLAIATTLYGKWERISHLTLQEFDGLKKDMSDWLSVINDMDDLLGARGHLSNSVRTIVDTTLETFSQELIHKAAPKPSVPSYATPHPPPPLQTANDYTRQPYARYPDPSQPKQVESPYIQQHQHQHQHQQRHQTSHPHPHQQQHHQQPETSQYATNPRPSYPTPQTSHSLPNNPNPNHATPAFMPTSYTEQPTYSNAMISPGAVGAAVGSLYPAPGSQQAWRQFTGGLAPNWISPGGDYLGSASALMSMGGAGTREGDNGGGGGGGVEGGQHRANSIYVEATNWPMSLFQPDGVGQ